MAASFGIESVKKNYEFRSFRSGAPALPPFLTSIAGKNKLFIFIDMDNSIIYDAPALEKAGLEERWGLRKQGN